MGGVAWGGQAYIFSRKRLYVAYQNLTSAGTVITEDHIKWIPVRASSIRSDTVLEASEMLGRTPKRGLRPDRPLRQSEIRRPVLVPKGSLVTMILRLPAMTLTARGKALQEGSLGDVIRIVNSQSNTVIEAVVSGSGRVSVTLDTHLAMN